MKLCEPRAGSFSCMHAKTWLFDDQVLFTGSPNLTHNGMENNVENLWKITSPSAVDEYVEFFERVWNDGISLSKTYDVGEGEIALMVEKHELRNERKRSQSQSRSMSRSLSKELEDHA